MQIAVATSRLVHPLGVATSPKERLAMAISAGALGTLGFSVTAPLLPDLARELGVSRGSIGVIQAAVSLPGEASTTTTPPGGSTAP